MPIVGYVDGFTVYMYIANHPPPHIHVTKGGNVYRFNIRDQALMDIPKQRLSRAEMRLVVKFIQLNQGRLLNNWQLCRMNQQPNQLP